MSLTVEQRLAAIVEAHHKDVDQHGGTEGWCAECQWAWPCPTYRWATEEGITPLCAWYLPECELTPDLIPEHTHERMPLL